MTSFRLPMYATTPIASIRRAPRAQTIRSPNLERRCRTGTSEPVTDSARPSSISIRATPMWGIRCWGSFWRHRLSKRRMAGGVVVGSAFQSGSRVRTAAMPSETVSPGSKAWRLVNISNSTHPNAHTSVRRSTGLPRACSGLMYAAVPRMTPAYVARMLSVGDIVRDDAVASRSSIFARPKSSTFTVPSGPTLMFAGFRSRWMTPFSCAASSASAI
jgi:hypothetical protein